MLPPAYFPVGLNLTGRRCIVIGAADDREASEKAAALHEAGANVIRLHDAAGIPETGLANAFFVLSTVQDAQFSARLRGWADKHRFLLCTIDQPEYGFVAMQATVASGPARIAISTGGVSPRVGGILRAALQDALDSRFARFLAALAERRKASRAEHPDDAAARRDTMMAAADGFEVAVQVKYPAWFAAEDTA